MRHLVTLVITLDFIINLMEISSATSSPPKTRDFLKNFGRSGQHLDHEESASTSGAGALSPKQPSRERERSPRRYPLSDGVKPIYVKITDWVPEDAWYEDCYGFRQIREEDGVRIFEAGNLIIGRISGDYIAPIFTKDHKFLISHKLNKNRWVHNNIEGVKKHGVGRLWFPLFEKARREYQERLREAAEERRKQNATNSIS